MAGKKKQIVMPQTNTKGFAEMSKKELRDWCKSYCRFKYKTSRKNSDSSV